jgi:hypothetical protein
MVFTLPRDTMVLPGRNTAAIICLRETESVIEQPWAFIYPPAGGFSSTTSCSGARDSMVLKMAPRGAG